MKTKEYTFCSLIIVILLVVLLPSCTKYGCPAANNPVDYAALSNPMEAQVKKKQKRTHNEFTGLVQDKNGRAISKRKAKRNAKKRKNTPNKRKKKVDRSKL